MEDIILKIEKSIWNAYTTENRIGLYSGLSGIIMFYDYICQIYPLDEYEDKLLVIIERTNELIENQESVCSLCHGMAGYGLVLLRLKNKNIDISQEYFENIDSYLLEDFESQCKSNDYDFMHGAMGIAMYFIERYKSGSASDAVVAILNAFAEKFIFEINTNFKNVLLKTDETNRDYYTFGMAHGVAGYLNFLEYFKKYFTSINITAPLRICVDFLASYKNFDPKSKQYYPNVFMLDSKKTLSSRLSWCQGDLGISNALYNAGIYLNDENLTDEAVNLTNHSATLSFEDSGVKDFGMCHGSSGILIQFYLASKKYNVDYNTAIEYWLDALKRQTNNFEEYLFYDKSTNEYTAETNLLFGSVGLALTLLTIENRIDTKWLEIFNLY